MARTPPGPAASNRTFDTAARVAAQFMILNGVLHIAIIFDHGLNSVTQAFAVAGALFIVFGVQAFRNTYWAKLAGLVLAILAASLTATLVDTADALRSWTNVYLAIELMITLLMSLHLWRLFRYQDLNKRSSEKR